MRSNNGRRGYGYGGTEGWGPPHSYNNPHGHSNYHYNSYAQQNSVNFSNRSYLAATSALKINADVMKAKEHVFLYDERFSFSAMSDGDGTLACFPETDTRTTEGKKEEESTNKQDSIAQSCAVDQTILSRCLNASKLQCLKEWIVCVRDEHCPPTSYSNHSRASLVLIDMLPGFGSFAIAMALSEKQEKQPNFRSILTFQVNLYIHSFVTKVHRSSQPHHF